MLKEDFHCMHWRSKSNGSKSLKQTSKAEGNVKSPTTDGQALSSVDYVFNIECH